MVETKFKQTEIGLIPEDWKVKLIGDSFKFKNGLNKEKHFFGYGFPIVNYMDVYRHTFIVDKFLKGKVFVGNTELNNYGVRKGDVLFTRTSETPEEIGISSVVVEDLNNAVFSGFVLRGRPYNDCFDLQFCRYCFSNNAVREQIIGNCTYTTRALTNGRVLSDIQIPLPPLPEQQAIAEVLSDTDAWIENLGKLIAKKRLIKQGAMQELLTPKEGWEEHSLDYYGYFTSGNGFPLIFQGRKNGQFPFYKVSDFNNIGNKLFMIDANNYISQEIANKLNCNIINKGAIILAKIGAAIFLERKKQATRPCCIDNNMMSYTVYEEKGDAKYFVYVLQSIQLGNLVTATALPSLSGKQVGGIIRKHPKKTEQTRIATILSDMDSEIESLENKLAKARQIKQGMMQELLTGRVRLINSVQKKEVKPKKHNVHFDDAVLIATMAYCFGTQQFPLTRFKYTKVSYLFKRYKEEQTTDYLKKAAGPYNPTTRYGGAEKIAIKNQYVVEKESEYKGKQYKGFIASEKIDEALNYFNEWHGEDALTWIQQFKFEKHDNLELWATVDMAMQDLKKEDKAITIGSIKKVLKADKEWQDKLQRAAFSDENILKAIRKMNVLYTK